MFGQIKTNLRSFMNKDWFLSKNGSWYMYKNGSLLVIRKTDDGFLKENLIEPRYSKFFNDLESAMNETVTTTD
jgi:hypothetical protein